MKLLTNLNTKVFIAIFAFLFLATSCEEIDELTQKDIKITLERTYNSNVTKDEIKKDIETFDISDDEYVKEYSDNLKGLKVVKMYYQIVGFSGADKAEANIKITNDNLMLASGNVKLKEAYENATMFEVEDNATLNEFADKLLQKKTVEVITETECKNITTPTKFKVKLRFELSLTVGL